MDSDLLRSQVEAVLERVGVPTGTEQPVGEFTTSAGPTAVRGHCLSLALATPDGDVKRQMMPRSDWCAVSLVIRWRRSAGGEATMRAVRLVALGADGAPVEVLDVWTAAEA